MRNSVQSQVFINTLFSALKALALIVALYTADAMLSATALGVILLFRRQGALWANLLQLGLSQSIIKFYGAEADSARRRVLWANIVRFGGLVSFFGVAVCFVFPAQVSDWTLSTPEPLLGVAFGIYTAGLSLGYLAGASWLSDFRLFHFNVLELINTSLIFIFAVFFASQLPPAGLATVIGGATLCVSCVSLLWFACQTRVSTLSVQQGWKLPSEVWIFGNTRALTAFADIATFVVGPWLLRAQPEQAGQLILAYSAIRIFQVAVQPAGQILALRANSTLYDARQTETQLILLSLIVFVIAWLTVGAYHLVGTRFLEAWLPNSHLQVGPILNELAVLIPGICLFHTLRNYVDLTYDAPINLATFLLAILVFFTHLGFSSEATLESVVRANKWSFGVYYLYGGLFLAVATIKSKRHAT